MTDDDCSVTEFVHYPVFYEKLYICPGCETYYKTKEEAADCCMETTSMWDCAPEWGFSRYHKTFGEALECIKRHDSKGS